MIKANLLLKFSDLYTKNSDNLYSSYIKIQIHWSVQNLLQIWYYCFSCIFIVWHFRSQLLLHLKLGLPYWSLVGPGPYTSGIGPPLNPILPIARYRAPVTPDASNPPVPSQETEIPPSEATVELLSVVVTDPIEQVETLKFKVQK